MRQPDVHCSEYNFQSHLLTAMKTFYDLLKFSRPIWYQNEITMNAGTKILNNILGHYSKPIPCYYLQIRYHTSEH